VPRQLRIPLVAGARLRYHVSHGQASWILLNKLVNHILHQDVDRSVVRNQEFDHAVIMLERRLHQAPAGSDACAACDEADLLANCVLKLWVLLDVEAAVARVADTAQGSLDIDSVTDV